MRADFNATNVDGGTNPNNVYGIDWTMRKLKRSEMLEQTSVVWRSIVFGTAGLISFVLFFRVFAPFADISAFFAIPLFCLGYLTVIFLIILIHELGHAFAARLMNWDVREIAVGALIYRPPSSSWTWDFDREFSLDAEDFGGWVVAIPPERGRLFLAHVVYCFGGPLATFTCGSVLLFAGFQLGTGMTDWSDALIGLGWLFYVDAVANLIPSHNRGRSRSDGMQLLDLIFAKR